MESRRCCLEQGFDSGFEGFLGGEADMLAGDIAIAIDNEGGGDAFDAAVGANDRIVTHYDGVVNVVFFDEVFDDGGAALIERDADDGEALIGVLFLEFHKTRNFFAAGRAPGGPEVEDDHFSGEIGAFDCLAADVLEFPCGCGFGWFGSHGGGDGEQAEGGAGGGVAAHDRLIGGKCEGEGGESEVAAEPGSWDFHRVK